jgi:hypothetical protein
LCVVRTPQYCAQCAARVSLALQIVFELFFVALLEVRNACKVSVIVVRF